MVVSKPDGANKGLPFSIVREGSECSMASGRCDRSDRRSVLRTFGIVVHLSPTFGSRALMLTDWLPSLLLTVSPEHRSFSQIIEIGSHLVQHV